MKIYKVRINIFEIEEPDVERDTYGKEKITGTARNVELLDASYALGSLDKDALIQKTADYVNIIQKPGSNPKGV